jgi:hypothetical protein
MTYRLVIHDDAEHTFEYVISLFTRVLGVGPREAGELATKIHEEGRAHVNFYELATAREAEERLLSGGPDRWLGAGSASLVVSIEEVEGDRTKVLTRGRVGARGYEPLEAEQVSKFHAASQEAFKRFAESMVARRLAARRCGMPPVFVVVAFLALVYLALTALG